MDVQIDDDLLMRIAMILINSTDIGDTMNACIKSL
jgi:hypothetical protein